MQDYEAHTDLVTSGAAKNGVQPFSLAIPTVAISSMCTALPKSASFTTRPLLKTNTLRAAREGGGREGGRREEGKEEGQKGGGGGGGGGGRQGGRKAGKEGGKDDELAMAEVRRQETRLSLVAILRGFS